MELLAKHEQLEVAAALRARKTHLDQIRRDDGLPKPYLEWGLRSTTDVAFTPFFASCYQLPGQAWQGGNDCSQLPDLYGLESCPSNANQDVRSHDIHAVIHQAFNDRLPFISEVAVATRHLHESVPADDAWRWCRGPDNVLLFETRPDLDLLDRYRIVSRLPAGLAKPTGLWWPGLVIALGVLGALAWWVSRRVFLLGLDPAQPASLCELLPRPSQAIERSLLIVCTRSCDRSPLLANPQVDMVDMVEIADVKQPAEVQVPLGKPVVCLDHFDHRLEEPAWNQKVLTWLEQLVYRERRTVILLVSREPDDLLFFTPRGALEEGAEALRERTIRESRWARILGRFIKVTAADDVEPFEPESAYRRAQDEQGEVDRARLERLFAVLRRECSRGKRLSQIGGQVVGHRGFVRLDPDALIDQIREMADDYYRALWSILGKEDKLVVAQLAWGSVINPKCWRSLRRLLSRRLVIKDPELRLMNESFSRFVREVVPAAEIAEWESEGTASAWQRLRFPLGLTVLAASVFLFVTQRELFNVAMAYFSAVAVGIPTIFKLLSLLQKRPGAGETIP